MRLIPLAALLLAGAAHATTVRIHYDAGASTITVDKKKARKGPDNVWTFRWPDQLGDISMKPALAGKLAKGGSYRIPAGSTQDIYPWFGAASGSVTIIPDFASPQLGNTRSLRIYLPPSYAENAAKRYPVLYMHDGQNLFDAKTAAYGVEWGIDETVNRMTGAGSMDEIIVVGIDNSPDRMAEYTPCCDPKHGGGKIDAYQAFITATVKPYIDRSLRTLPGRENTAIMGSSLGAIASVIIAQRQPQLFSKAGGVSSSFWWNNGALLASPAARVDVKFYLDAGANNDGLEDSLAMRDAMLAQGYINGSNLMFYSDPDGQHNEKSWAARVDKPLSWFFPWGSSGQRALP